MDRQTLLTPFSPHSLPRPSAQAVAGRTGHWDRNSRHPAGHVLASGACLVRRPGWPSLGSCRPQLGCGGAGRQAQTRPDGDPGVGGS